MAPPARRASVRPRRLAAGLILFAVLLAGFWFGLGSSASSRRREAARPSAVAASSPAAGRLRPNIVFVLIDDLSTDLIPYMPQVQALERRGLISTTTSCPTRCS